MWHGFTGLAPGRNNALASYLVVKKLVDLEAQAWKTHEGIKQVGLG